MANQIEITVIGKQGEYPLCFSTDSFIAQEGSDTKGAASTITSYNTGPVEAGTRYPIKESIDQILHIANSGGVAMIKATVVKIDSSSKMNLRSIFPANAMVMGVATEGGANAYVHFRGKKYYTLETYDDLIDAANDTSDRPIPLQQVQSDWSVSDVEAKSFIRNKPSGILLLLGNTVPNFANNAAALAGGLHNGDIYQNAGTLMIVTGTPPVPDVMTITLESIGDSLIVGGEISFYAHFDKTPDTTPVLHLKDLDSGSTFDHPMTNLGNGDWGFLNWNTYYAGTPTWDYQETLQYYVTAPYKGTSVASQILTCYGE